jgi:hypothetical protein
MISPTTGIKADHAVDAVADIGAGQDEGDVEQFRERIEPRQPLLAGEIAERIDACIAEIEPENSPHAANASLKARSPGAPFSIAMMARRWLT